ncbi:MAG: hypothetical protein KC496_10575 [Anaerolineae bacterium]|nr:hypothetical protein [Anaerolineae bacterium]
MMGLLLIFVILLLIWLGTIYWFYQKQTVMRVFVMLTMGSIFYMYIAFLLWAAQAPGWLLAFVGLLPIVLTVAGYTLYERSKEREKQKNDEKAKNDDLVNA